MNHLKELLNMLHCPMVFFTNKGTCFAGFLSGFDTTLRKIIITNFQDIKRNTYHRGQSWADITSSGGVTFERVEVNIDEIKDLHLLNEGNKIQNYSKYNQQQYSGSNNVYRTRNFNQPIQREVNRNVRGHYSTSGSYNNRTSTSSYSNPNRNTYSSVQNQFNNSSSKTFLNISNDDLKNDYDIEKFNNDFLKVYSQKDNEQHESSFISDYDNSHIHTNDNNNENNDAHNVEGVLDFFDHISSSAIVENVNNKKSRGYQLQQQKENQTYSMRQNRNTRRINSTGRRNNGNIKGNENVREHGVYSPQHRRPFLLKTGVPGQDFIIQKAN